jgi:hypothetical protein
MFLKNIKELRAFEIGDSRPATLVCFTLIDVFYFNLGKLK